MTDFKRVQLEAAEKRVQGLRLRKFIDVIVEDPAASMLFRGAIADISETGMRVVSDQYLPKNSSYLFTMKRSPHLAVRGEIRWIRSWQGETFLVGVQFTQISESDRQRLNAFLDLERRRLTTPT